MTHPDDERVIEDEIQAEHVHKLYDEATTAVAAHLTTAGAVVALLWPTLPSGGHGGLLMWMTAMVLASGLRGYSLYLFRRSARQRSAWRFWARIAIAFNGLLGLIWAAGVLAFFDIHNLTSAMMLTVIPVGIVAAATATNASVPPAYYVLEIPMTLAVVLVMALSGTPLGYTIAALMVVTALLRVRISRHVHSILDASLRVGYENLALRQEAERANAAKSRFLAAASHDLRQPIHALGLSFSALSQRLDKAGTGHLTRQIEGCIDAVQQMLEALLDVSKLDAGVVHPEYASMDPAGLVRRMEVELAPIARQNGTRLRVRTARLPRVRTDPSMLDCILRNLIGNALHYTNSGHVLVTARRHAGGVRIAVLDTGVGIPEDQLQDIFLEFRQLKNPQRNRHQGLGLGLAIVKRLAALLDHPIGVQSQPGKGSCFWIQLPAAAEPEPLLPPLVEQEPSWAASQQEGHSVLVLDDDPSVREAMVSLLISWGYRVHAAESLAEALKLDATDRFDALVVDYRLPDDVTGAEAIDALQQQRGATIPVLLVTGDTAPDRLQQAQSLGLPLLHKPVKPARLRAALNHLCATDRSPILPP